MLINSHLVYTKIAEWFFSGNSNVKKILWRHKLGLAGHYSSCTVCLWGLSCQAHSFLMRHNSSPPPHTHTHNARIKEVIIIFFVHESFTQISIKGFTLRRRVAFLHEMDITVRRGSSLYPWENWESIHWLGSKNLTDANGSLGIEVSQQ